MKEFLLAALGGAAGSGVRYLCNTHLISGKFPYSTFVVNIAGCLLFGIVAGKYRATDPMLTVLLMTGFCGGLTTFSSFSAENLQLILDQRYLMAGANILLSLLLGIVFTYLGFILTK